LLLGLSAVRRNYVMLVWKKHVAKCLVLHNYIYVVLFSIIFM
jgi:hypothetical protein